MTVLYSQCVWTHDSNEGAATNVHSQSCAAVQDCRWHALQYSMHSTKVAATLAHHTNIVFAAIAYHHR